jgi:hypothetical protein
MDESAKFRILPMDEFLRLTLDQKFTYLQAAIKALLIPRDGAPRDKRQRSDDSGDP